MEEAGIMNDTTVILYGDNNNWFAAWAPWQMKIYGHSDVRLMNGGRRKWLEEGRELTTDPPQIARSSYICTGEPDFDPGLPRRFGTAARAASAALVDVRSPDEFTGSDPGAARRA